MVRSSTDVEELAMMNAAGKTFLPEFLMPAHNLCFLSHDILLQLLRSGEKQRVFDAEFEFRDESERAELGRCVDIFEWFERTGRTTDRNDVLRRRVFPAVLSDFLHFIFEALETSRKGKLTTSYALLRKPLQDNLFLLEVIAADVERFGADLAEDPVKLESRTAGDRLAHSLRIASVLQATGEDGRFDADFLAQLRYDKSTEDSFAGASNQALHLFTDHKAIRTEPLNINFVFSDWEAKQTQWYYLYSRLPYLLIYARRLVEHVCAAIAKSDPSYLADMERRVAAGAILWARNIEKNYRHAAIDRLIDVTRRELDEACKQAGYRKPRLKDLPNMRDTGAYPDETTAETKRRAARYASGSSRNRAGHGPEKRTRASRRR